MKYNLQVTDKKLEEDGAWVEWPMAEDTSIKLRRRTKATVEKQLDMLLKKNRKALRNTDLQKEVMIKFLSNHVIVDWKGVTGDDKELEYSPEVASDMLEAIDDFYTWVLTESANVLNFSDEEDDTTVEERGEELKK